MFTRIAASLAAVALGTVGIAEDASARTRCHTTTTAHRICATDNGHSGTDYITAWNSSGTLVSQMSVICTGRGGNRWSATTSYSKSENQKLANAWCDGYQ
jgi:aspartate oxidase